MITYTTTRGDALNALLTSPAGIAIALACFAIALFLLLEPKEGDEE